MRTKITWFRHNHENRNDLLRFGLMKLHFDGMIRYIEKPFCEITKYGFSNAVLNYPDHRHLSFLSITNNKTSIRCIVDNEDSFALLSSLISESDVYFCAGYNSDFMENKRFVKAYNWQDETDLNWYKETLKKKIDQYGVHFYKIKKFIPIAPNLAMSVPFSSMKRKLLNLDHKMRRLLKTGNRFTEDYIGFEIRYQYLQNLRNNSLQFDIVLNDTLWGWPSHRVNLHTELGRLHNRGYKIHSILRWADPVCEDGSILKRQNKAGFPMSTSSLNGSYEHMLSQSRLAVFACGFHWGWRNIMMLALMTGIPVLTDRLLTEPYFDMSEFHIFQKEDHSWSSIENNLVAIDKPGWDKIKLHNQSVYDKYMSPGAVGRYFLNSFT
jgi:hypothetical protein